MAVNLSLLAGAGWQFFDDNGDPLTGGRLFTYAAGTTTPLATYTSSSGATPNTNPIILNAAGRLSGSGEIWLTEGVLYKFVLTDANNVLIGTYDNVFGATDGSSIYAALANTADPAKGDALVGFRQSNNSGNLLGSVGRTVHQKLQEIVSFRDFGAVGNGVTDDTAAVQAALNSGALVLDGQNLTYLVTAALTGQSGQTIQNARFKVASLPTNGSFLTFAGTQGAAVAAATNVSAGAFSITVADASSFAANGWVFIRSNKFFSPAALDNVLCGEMLHVESIAGNVLTLHTPTLLEYLVADSATVAPLATAKNIVLQNLTIEGPVSTGNQRGVTFQYCEQVEVRNCNTFDFDHTHLWFERCANYAVRGGAAFRTGLQEGLDYGVAHLRGSYNGLVDGYTGNSMRHISTIGGSEGVCRFIRVVNCFGYNLTDGGIDSHSACYEHDFSHNFLLFSNSADTTIEGIVSQGGLLTCVGNTVIGARRHGAAWTPEIANDVVLTGNISAVIAKNIFEGNKNVVGTAAAVLVSSQTSATPLKRIDGAVISGNLARDFDVLALVATRTGGATSKVVVDSNVCRSSMAVRGVQVVTGGHPITDVVISNNILSAVSNEVVYCLGTSTEKITNVNIANNLVDGGTISLRLLHTDNVATSGNQLRGASSQPRLTSNTTGLMAYDIAGTVEVGDIRQQVTIAADAVTIDNPIRRILRVDTEGGAATDDLSTINGGYVGQQIQVMSTASARDVTCKDGVGNLRLSGDQTLSHPEDVLTLWFDGTVWYQVAFADNNA